MWFFFVYLGIGLLLTVLLLLLFFKAGKRSKKQLKSDLAMVLGCGDASLIRLYEQAESDNEREGILEFVKEKLASKDGDADKEADMAIDIIPAGEINVAALPAEPAETTLPPALEATKQPLALDKIDWGKLEEEIEKNREAEALAMAQNMMIQQVFSKIRNVESRISENPSEHGPK